MIELDNFSKLSLGQYYTTNVDYIFKEFNVPKGKIIEPFAGQGDIIRWTKRNDIEAYDIDPKGEGIIKRDTLINPPNYKGKYVITNPPFRARNKNPDKTIYDLYDSDDLFRCFLLTILDCEGGLLILPVSFFTAPRCKVRGVSLSHFIIEKVSYFEETVFDDTNINIVVFSFSRFKTESNYSVKWKRFPTEDFKIFELFEEYNWLIGGELHHLKPSGKYKIKRLLQGYNLKENEFLTHLTLTALDSGDKRISLIFDPNYSYSGKNTSRTYATIITVGIELTPKQQGKIARAFNRYIESWREETWSLCLPSYRENMRKRVPFDLAYQIILSLIDLL